MCEEIRKAQSEGTWSATGCHEIQSMRSRVGDLRSLNLACFAPEGGKAMTWYSRQPSVSRTSSTSTFERRSPVKKYSKPRLAALGLLREVTKFSCGGPNDPCLK